MGEYHSQPMNIPSQVLVFGSANEDWSDSPLFDGDAGFMEHTFSQHSWESGPDSSPGNSYKDPFYGNQYVNPAVGASSVTAPHMSFEESRFMGAFAQDNFNLQSELDDQDLFVSPQQMTVGSPTLDTGTWSAGGTSAPNSYTPHPALTDLSSEQNGRFRCPHDDCMKPDGSGPSDFKRRTDLKRHISTRHNSERFDCEIGGFCNRSGERGFIRRDHYIEHLREVHKRKIPVKSKLSGKKDLYMGPLREVHTREIPVKNKSRRKK